MKLLFNRPIEHALLKITIINTRSIWCSHLGPVQGSSAVSRLMLSSPSIGERLKFVNARRRRVLINDLVRLL